MRVLRSALVASVLCVVLCLSAIVAAQAPASAPAQQPTAAQDGFVPVSQLPPAEELAPGPLVLGAYGFIWVAVLVYVWSLARRLNAVQKDFDALSKRQR